MSLLLALACTPTEPLDSDSPVDSADSAPVEEPPRALPLGANTLEHDGLQREFLLHRAEDLAAGAPLVLVMHGYGGTAEGIRAYSGFDAIAEREGFAVAYPQGTSDAWGASYWEVGYAFHDQSVDDLGFLRALVEHLAEDLGSDRSRVFATGMSNGGDMSYRLACEADQDFAALAPVAGCLMGVVQDSCSPDSQPDLLEIHGTEDRITPWEGDPQGSGGYGPYLGTEESVGHFVEAYALELYDSEELPDSSTGDGSHGLAHRWSSASSPARVQLYEIVGGRHDWPGAGGNEDIDASEEIWAFFEATAPR